MVGRCYLLLVSVSILVVEIMVVVFVGVGCLVGWNILLL